MHERTKVSRRVNGVVMTKACALYLITKWMGGSHFKFYASHLYAVGLPVNSVISRVKIKELSAHQVTCARHNLGNIINISNHCCHRGADKSLAQPGRKQARKHVRDARDFNNIETRTVIKFFFYKARHRRKFTPF